MSDLRNNDLSRASVDDPATFSEIMGMHKPTGWPGRVPDPQEQRAQALVRERDRRVDAEKDLQILQKAIRAHRAAVPRKNRRKADKVLYSVLDDDDPCTGTGPHKHCPPDMCLA